MDAALLPFAGALGLSVYIPAQQIAGGPAALGFACATIVLACTFWYGSVIVKRTSKENGRMKPNSEPTPRTPLHDKIRQALTEARVIIPGNQALLGFQFAVILQRGFMDLAPWIKWVHLVSLSLITISTILLMTPAAYHRIAEDGEETGRFYRVTRFMVLASLPPLALGVCTDFFIVMFKISGDLGLSLVVCGVLLCLFAGFWFAYPVWRRSRHSGTRRLANAILPHG
jgi:hypothetical protein